MPQATPEVDPEFLALELENSFPLDQSRRFRPGGGGALVQSVLDGMRAKEQRVRRRTAGAAANQATSVEVLLVNLVAAAINSFDPHRFVGVSFNREDYRFTGISRDHLAACRDYLFAERLIEGSAGFRRPDYVGETYFGRRSRLKATDKLRDLIDVHELDKRSLTIPSVSLIRMKNAAPGLAGPTVHVEASRALIERLNQRLAAISIDLPDNSPFGSLLGNVTDDGEDPGAKVLKRKYAGDLTAVALYRSFSATWERGGRLYGGWWMSLNRELRPYLLINGEPVVELDFKWLHPRMLFHRAGKKLDFDPYLIGPWNTPEMRTLGKRTFNRLLNREDRDAAKRLIIRAARGDIRCLPRGQTFASYVLMLTAQLAPIEQWFGTGVGIQLQTEDSELALSVLDRLDQQDIPALPIHDSFIVSVSHEAQLKEAMMNAYFEQFEHTAEIDRKGPRQTALQFSPPRVHN